MTAEDVHMDADRKTRAPIGKRHEVTVLLEQAQQHVPNPKPKTANRTIVSLK